MCEGEGEGDTDADGVAWRKLSKLRSKALR